MQLKPANSFENVIELQSRELFSLSLSLAYIKTHCEPISLSVLAYCEPQPFWHKEFLAFFFFSRLMRKIPISLSATRWCQTYNCLLKWQFSHRTRSFIWNAKNKVKHISFYRAQRTTTTTSLKVVVANFLSSNCLIQICGLICRR